MKIKNLLTKKNWIKFDLAQNKDGGSVDADSSEACKFCLSGAIERVYSDEKDYSRVYIQVMNYIGMDYFNISDWNDQKERKFSDVKKLVDKLNI